MKFTTTIEQEAGKDHAGIPVPAEVVEALDAGKRPKVIVTVGSHTYRNSVASMGGRYLISLSAANREAAGVAGGDVVEVTLEVDGAPRVIDVPDGLAVALKQDHTAATAFESLSYSRKSRIVLAIDGAKTEETRQRRITKAIEDLRTGKA
ncbi:MAG: YdeI/OmpD-associated family protein, partial [Dehalococcoidia bacterium]